MTKSIVTLAVLLSGLSAQAAGTVIARCQGSVLEGRSMSENYTILVNEQNDLVVDSQYKDGFSISLSNAESSVKILSQETLVAQEVRRTLSIPFTKKSVVIDFKTGEGKAKQYLAIESLLKARTIYLFNCTR